MSSLRFELASPADDGELRQLLAATPMSGKLSVSFRREPSYFGAAAVEGEFHQTIVARDGTSGSIVGIANRSVRQRFVNGAAMAVGYLGSLRVLPRHRGGRVLADGYRFLRELHGDRRASIYLTTIAEGNHAALALLTSGRASLPRYEFIGMYHTGAIPLGGKSSAMSAPPGVTIRCATVEDWPQLIDFLDRTGPSRQYFPCYQSKDWFDDAATFRGLGAGDLFLAVRGGDIVGTLACWDQSRFRQVVVENYGSTLALTAPVYNGWAALRGLPKLPKPGTAFPFLTAALPAVAGNDLDIFSALLDATLAHGCQRGFSHVLVGLHERDPLTAVIECRQTSAYKTRCYLVYWEDGATARQQIDGCVPYLELGCL